MGEPLTVSHKSLVLCRKTSGALKAQTHSNTAVTQQDEQKPSLSRIRKFLLKGHIAPVVTEQRQGTNFCFLLKHGPVTRQRDSSLKPQKSSSTGTASPDSQASQTGGAARPLLPAGPPGSRPPPGLRDPNFRGAPPQLPPAHPEARRLPSARSEPSPARRRCPVRPTPPSRALLPPHLPRTAAGRARAAERSRRADLCVGCGQAAHVAVAEPSVGRAAAAVGTGLSTQRRRSPLGPLHPAAAGHDPAAPHPLRWPHPAAPRRTGSASRCLPQWEAETSRSGKRREATERRAVGHRVRGRGLGARPNGERGTPVGERGTRGRERLAQSQSRKFGERRRRGVRAAQSPGRDRTGNEGKGIR